MTLWYAVVCSLGVAANTLAYLSLRRTPPSTPGRTLLRHQCFLDAALCVAGFVLLTQSQWWHSGLPALDAILCRLWHSEFLFSCHAKIAGWSSLIIVTESILVAIGLPCFSLKEICFHLSVLYVIGYTSSAPDLTTMALVNGKCVTQIAVPIGLDPISFHRLSFFARQIGRIVPCIYLFVFVRRADAVWLTFQYEPHSLIGRQTQTRSNTITYYAVLAVVITTVTLVTAFTLRHWRAPPYCRLVRNHDTMTLAILCKSLFSALFFVVVLPTYRHALQSTILCRPGASSTLEMYHDMNTKTYNQNVFSI